MKEILQTIIENLVDDKNAISINEIEEEKSIVYEVKVSETDMGKVIGKQGKIARFYKKHNESNCSKRT